MKLKKKVIFGMVAGFFALATVFNMSMLNEIGAGDVSLDAIAVMAEAQDGEMGTNCTNCKVSWEECPDGREVIRCRLGGTECFAEWQDLC